MSDIWNSLVDIQNYLINSFEKTGTEIQEKGMEKFNHDGWVNRVWTSKDYRRAHIDIVDARDTRGLWMMHCCVFPHVSSDGPIFGFDVIAGKNKMTGAFFDFSPTTNSDHEMIKNFGDYVSNLDWKRERELPEWAKAIFSKHMVAAGNINSLEESAQVLEMVKDNLDYYLEEIGNTLGRSSDNIGILSQNNYAHFQKQNPHTPKTMTALGLDENDVKEFIEICLFPELETE